MIEKKIEKLINDFVESARKYHNATMLGNARKVNAQSKRMYQAFVEITKLGEVAKRALLAQTSNEDDAVALMAATYSLKYDPEKSKSVLERLAKYDTGVIGFGAEQALQRWEEGVWQIE